MGTMFLLGLRHGLDPDHLSIIDGLTLQASRWRSKVSPWVGTLFSLGHGGIVTAIALLVSVASHHVEFPPLLVSIGGWLPVALLLLVAGLNLRTLLRAEEPESHWLVEHVLPSWLKGFGHPAAIVLIGMLFGLVFDTATQIAAWSYVAGEEHSASGALALGLAFTLGMVVTDTVDSRLLFGLLRRVDRQDAARFRRRLTWAIVALSMGMACLGAMRQLVPEVSIDEGVILVAGVLVVLAPLAGSLWRLRRRHGGPSLAESPSDTGGQPITPGRRAVPAPVPPGRDSGR